MYKHTVESTNNEDTITIVHTYTYDKKRAYKKLARLCWPFQPDKNSEERYIIKFLGLEFHYWLEESPN